MGKGDKKTKKGKIVMGTFGASRPKKSGKAGTPAKGVAKKAGKKAGK